MLHAVRGAAEGPQPRVHSRGSTREEQLARAAARRCTHEVDELGSLELIPLRVGRELEDLWLAGHAAVGVAERVEDGHLLLREEVVLAAGTRSAGALVSRFAPAARPTERLPV